MASIWADGLVEGGKTSSCEGINVYPTWEKNLLTLTVRIKKRYWPPRGPTGRRTMITAHIKVEHILHTKCAEGIKASMVGVRKLHGVVDGLSTAGAMTRKFDIA